MADPFDATWQAGLARLEKAAAGDGVPEALWKNVVAGLRPDPDVLERALAQPEQGRSTGDYLELLVSSERIDAGQRMRQLHRSSLAGIAAAYGVPAEVILAIWGIESQYGSRMGTYDVLRSLATLAAQGERRREFWATQFAAAVAILADGHASRDRLVGSWAGAMGHVQFMPTTFRDFAVDYDGDGRADIWASIPDALASAANYLARSGWAASGQWGAEVVLPAGFDFAALADGEARPLAVWLKAGVGLASPAAKRPLADAMPYRLLLPAGGDGPAFLVSANFDAILTYNAAVPYALAVGHLADRLAGGPPLSQPWPSAPALTLAERKALQAHLVGRGYDTGGIDGVLGRASRVAVRQYQLEHGLMPDGFASRDLLDHLAHS
jgi:membrane-bound lytic murein transglycosylase B